MDTDKLFDAFNRMTSMVHNMDKQERLRNELRSLRTPKCGHCDLWMKRGCKPEKEKGLFISANHIPCRDFSLDNHVRDIIEEKENELSLINNEFTMVTV